jgi:hypothetical protein
MKKYSIKKEKCTLCASLCVTKKNFESKHRDINIKIKIKNE